MRRLGEAALRLGRGGEGVCCRPEHRKRPITGVLEHPAVMALHDLEKHLVVGGESGAHRLGMEFPQPRRTLDVGE